MIKLFKHGVPVGEPFPVDEVVSATTEGAEAYRDQSAVLEAAALIRQMREGAKLTQRELAQRVRTTQPHLSELERGTGSQGPTFLMLQRIAKACGTALHIEVGARSEAAPAQAVAEEKLAQADDGIREALGKVWGSSPTSGDLAGHIMELSDQFSGKMLDWLLLQQPKDVPAQVTAMSHLLDKLPLMEIGESNKGPLRTTAARAQFVFWEKSQA